MTAVTERSGPISESVSQSPSPIDPPETPHTLLSAVGQAVPVFSPRWASQFSGPEGDSLATTRLLGDVGDQAEGISNQNTAVLDITIITLETWHLTDKSNTVLCLCAMKTSNSIPHRANGLKATRLSKPRALRGEVMSSCIQLDTTLISLAL